MRLKGIISSALIMGLFFLLITIGGCKKNVEAEKRETVEEQKKEVKLRWFSYDQGLEQAKKSKKFILLDFYSERCPWCKVLDEKVYNEKKIKDYLKEDFILIRIDAYRERSLAQKYGVRGLPYILFLESDGRSVAAILPGYVYPNIFIKVLRYVESGSYKRMSIDNYLRGGVDTD